MGRPTYCFIKVMMKAVTENHVSPIKTLINIETRRQKLYYSLHQQTSEQTDDVAQAVIRYESLAHIVLSLRNLCEVQNAECKNDRFLSQCWWSVLLLCCVAGKPDIRM